MASALSAPAQAAGAPAYVALGDSYSSGTGTGSYLADGTQCQRSTYSYGALIAASRGYSLNLRACSGAVVSDVAATQLSVLNGSTSYVTISVGGNDAGFADVLTECAQPGWMSDCDAAINTAQSFIKTTLPNRLNSLYTSIRAKAPNAKVVVVGYPRIFNGEDCNVLTFFSPAEETRLNSTADQLNAVLRTAATNRSFSFANPTSRFVGHAWCDDTAWLNGLKTTSISESYHPNKAGHASGYQPTVSPYLTGATVTSARVAPRTASSLAARLTNQQKAFAALDRRIKPKVMKVPDLNSRRAKRAAKAAGINLKKWVAKHAR